MANPKFKVGDWVWLKPLSGFLIGSEKLRAQILSDGYDYCRGCCGVDGCQEFEWATLATEPDPENNGVRHSLYHVCESRMTPADAPS